MYRLRIKKIVWTVAVMLMGGFLSPTHAQIKERVVERAKESSSNKAERTVDETIESVGDGIVNGVKGIFTKKGKKNKDKGDNQSNGMRSGDGQGMSGEYGSEDWADEQSQGTMDSEMLSQGSPSLSKYTKFSFVQGEDIIAYDDFMQDKVGDLPASWITTGTAEIVNFDGIDGNWVWFNKTKGNFIPEYLSDFPENFTVEFDLMYDFAFGAFSMSRSLMLVFTDISNPEGNMDWDGGGDYFNLQKLSDNYLGIQFSGNSHDGGPYIIARKAVHTEKGLNFRNDFNAKHLINAEGANEPIHISISRMRRRVQVFANEEKVLDLTAAFQKDVKLTSARFFVNNATDGDNYYLSNIRYAVGQPDTRNKLLASGTYSTSAITFNSGSAEIKPESYAILKEIADALKSESGKFVSIIGHTDSDGSAELNQRLSEERAAAVKMALQNEFGVSNTMETSGKGASDPIAENNTPTGKANNRRVEFILN
ncbi:outer membrane protein OmpA-like peptidoglycan-associated protein [Algoriphagus sp. 4150]|uniref:OmpA family protein n=1 Tax=Algoriphagus sp. 4150 TaxID=2817756 RepID=UPI002855C770|nr:OmpA family protein [Algoriphagus sp. 4150]MDR7128988.1 outer membrane protein OmpA-like peptidoglycan-associated protein [Algoriphagus sp. 4150]